MICSNPHTLHNFLLIFKNSLQDVFLHCLNPLLQIGPVESLEVIELLPDLPLVLPFLVYFSLFTDF